MRYSRWGLILLGLTALEAGDPEASIGALDEGARALPNDAEAQVLAALALHAGGWEDRAYEMLERARIAVEGFDSGLVDHAEAEMESSSGASLEFLKESLGPSVFRERLMVRP
jgi:hypothetical protein